MVEISTKNNGISNKVLTFEHKVINEINYFAINTEVNNKKMSRYHLIAFGCPLLALKFHDSNISDIDKGATIEECINSYKKYITLTFEKIK